MSAVPSREVTSTQVAGITFGFYSDDEVSPFSDECRILLLSYSMLYMVQMLGLLFDRAIWWWTLFCDLRGCAEMEVQVVRYANAYRPLNMLLYRRFVSSVSSRSPAPSCLTTSRTLLLEACMIRP